MRRFVAGPLLSLLVFACQDGIPTRPEEVPPVITGSISGTVRAESDGRPLAGAQIVIAPGNGAAVTDTAGRFVVTFLAPGSYTLQATRTGFDPVTTIVTLQPQDPDAEIDLLLASKPATPPSLGDRLAVRTYADQFPTAEGTIRFHVDVLVTDGERLSAVTIHDSLDAVFRPLTASTVELNPTAFPHATFEIGANGQSVAVSLGAVMPTDGEYVRALTLTVPVPSIGGVYCSTAVASSPGLPSPRETTCIVRTL